MTEIYIRDFLVPLVPGRGPYGASFDATVFTRNRRRLLRHKVGRTLFEEVACEADRLGLISSGCFSVDGTLMEAAASIKSYRRRNDEDDTDDSSNGAIHTGKMSNETHESRGEADEKGRGKEAKCCLYETL